MRSSAFITCLVFLLFLPGIFAAALQPPGDQNQNPALNSAETSTPPDQPSEALPATSSSLTPESTPLHLPVTPSDPDVLGIAQISGFYGPGAWAAWFLTVLGSWWRALRASDAKFDPNTWLFLLGTNWAAVDMSRTMRQLAKIPAESITHEAEFKSHMGALGAAFNMTFWGALHAVTQLIVVLMRMASTDAVKRRTQMLLCGLVLPLVILPLSIAPGPDLSGLLPAVDWDGMDIKTHNNALALAAFAAPLFLPCMVWFALGGHSWVLPKTVKARRDAVGSWLSDLQRTSSVIRWILYLLPFALLVLGIGSVTAASLTRNGSWLFGLLPLLAFSLKYYIAYLMIALMLWIAFVPLFSIAYVFRAYVARWAKVSESCFFMPCAPQSIKEEDQLYALLGGVLAFVGCEVLPVALGGMKKWYRGRRHFIMDMEGRMRQLELRRILGGGRSSTTGIEVSPADP